MRRAARQPETIISGALAQLVWNFRQERISRYDEQRKDWYWNNFSCGEHTGTHFDAPVPLTAEETPWFMPDLCRSRDPIP